MEQFELMMAKSRVAQLMSKRGIMVDPARFITHRKSFAAQSKIATNIIQQTANRVGFGEIVVPTRLKQLHRLFFDTLKCKPHKWGDSGAPSLDAAVLDRFMTHHDDRVRQVAAAVLKFREFDKLRATYIDGLEYNTATNTLHPEWKVNGARTGRWSCSPGLQTIPAGKAGRTSLRDLFVARPGFKLIAVDYSALELRIAALLSGDEIFMRAFDEGRDAHIDTAVAIFKKKVEKADPKRALAKMANYQLLYGGSPVALWKKAQIDYPNIALADMERLHSQWYDIHHWIAKWHHEKLQRAITNKYIECPLSGRQQIYADGEIDMNEVLNFDVQGTGADIIDPALIKIADEIDWADSAILLQVHDELVGEARDWLSMARLMKRHMEQTITYNGRSMTFTCEVQVGDDWEHMEKVDV